MSDDGWWRSDNDAATDAEKSMVAAAYDAETALLAAGHATKMAVKAKDAVDPAKQAERQRAEQEKRDRVEFAWQEPSFLRRLSPRRNRWRDIAAFDERVAELERRRTEIAAQIADLHTRAQTAAATHEEQLAAWFAAGSTKDRPVSEVPALEQEIADRHADAEAAARAIDTVLAEKHAYVEQHRPKLQAEAAKATAAARQRYLAAVEEARQARTDLIEQRAEELWVAAFPDPAASEQAGFPVALCLGLKAPVAEFLPGQTAQIPAAGVFDVLARDAETVAAMATGRQAELLGAKKQRSPLTEAMWTQEPDYQDWLADRRREFQAKAPLMDRREFEQAVAEVREK